MFTLSGAIGLVYEGLCARYLKLFLGHSAYGQITTLSIYMGGLGVGSFLGAAVARRVRQPLYVYGAIELAAGLCGLCFHFCYVNVTEIFYRCSWLAQMGNAGYTAAKVCVSVALASPIAILLGMTFPCLAVALMRRRRDSGVSSLPMLYFVNSLGAATGILALSYVLVATLGTAGALRAAATGNLFIALGFGIVAWVAQRAEGKNAEAVDSATLYTRLPDTGRTVLEGGVWFWLLLSGLTGFSSFVYEVCWIRLLSMVLGSATHSFDIMVSAFIFGLAFGGLYSRRVISHTRSLPRAFAGVQLLMGICAVFTVYAYRPLFVAMNHSHVLFPRTDTGYVLVGIYKYLVCLMAMFPACFCAGMTLPLITCYLTQCTGNEMHTGTVYGWNTVGAIVGAAVGGLVMLPGLQLRMTLVTAAFVDMAIGAVVLFRVRTRLSEQTLAWGVAVLAIVPATVIPFDKDVLVAGPYRYRVAFDRREGTVVRDGATATISFQRRDSSLVLKSNGKVEASLNPYVKGKRCDDEYTQAAVAFVPMALMDTAYTAAMIGFGSGMTAHHLLSDDRLEQLDIVEIEREVPRVARGFYPYNCRAFDDPRVHVVIDDAKSYFHTSRKRYRLIISEPSNPWVSGVSSLFTREFYGRVREFLHDDGMLVQWVHLYDFTTPLLLSILKALQEHFPRWQLYGVPHGSSDVIVVAWPSTVSRTMNWKRVEGMPRFQHDLEFLGVNAETFGLRNYIVSQKTLAPLLEEIAPNSDFMPIVENGAEKAFFLDSWVDLLEPFTENRFLYQEILEPEEFAPAFEHICLSRVSQALDTGALQRVMERIAAVDETTDWDWLDSAFFSTAYAYVGTPAWRNLELVGRYRDVVYAGSLPRRVWDRFRLLDFASRGLHAEATAVLSDMVRTYPRSEAGAALVNAMTMVALRSGDRELFSTVFEQFIEGNADIGTGERMFLASLYRQWCQPAR